MTESPLEIKREYARLRRLAFPGEDAAVVRRWEKKNPEWVKAFAKINYHRHRDSIRAYHRRWYLKNIVKIKDRVRNWKDNNKASIHSYCAKRRAIEKAPASKSEARKIRKVYARAEELRQWFDVVVDHIIPIAKGGEHIFSNLQILYRDENNHKKARLDYGPSVIFR